MSNAKRTGAAEAGPGKDQYLEPSSSTTGFFQEIPNIENQFQEDAAFNRVLQSYLPPRVQENITPDLSSFGDLVLSKRILDWTADAEKNVPYLKTWDTFGKRQDELVTTEGWKKLQDTGIEHGMVAIAYENKNGPYSRVHHFLKYHLWSGSCANVTCPSGMTDGAASLFSRHLSSPSLPASMRPILESAYRRLISRVPSQAWTSGQWMTERKGGSDISGTETLAKESTTPLQSTGVEGSPLGPYSISGFKWFSSATDANMSILLARTPSGHLSAFYAPMRRTVPSSPSTTELNGVTIQRLKNKLGTRSLPTAELVLTDMRGYMIGDEGNGVREIATLLNITRIHTAVTAMGYWGRGLGVSRAFARVRLAGGKKLMDIPAHVATMSAQHVEYRGWMHLTFFTVLLLGHSEQLARSPSSFTSAPEQPSLSILTPLPSTAPILLRLLTPIVKALTAKYSIAGLAECMESLGGVGYLENEDAQFNIARLFRDANVSSIWEGTTDILASDLLRVVKGRQGEAALGAVEGWLEKVSEGLNGESGSHGRTEKEGVAEVEALRERWHVWRARVQGCELGELQLVSREVMMELGRILGGVLLVVDAERDGDEVAKEVARRWTRLGSSGIASGVGSGSSSGAGDWRERVKADRKIVFGGWDVGSVSARL